MNPEEKARIKIDELLSASGWEVQTKDKVNLGATRGVAICELSFASGEPDYTLFVDGICRLKAAHPKGGWLVHDQARILLRFIKHFKGGFREIKESGRSSVRVGLDGLSLLSAARIRTKREGGALLVYDASGFP